RYYSERFRAVEVNSTFNKMPKASVLKGWTDTVPPDFKFVLKAPRQITHRKRLKEADALVAQFLAVAETLAKHQGPLFFQLPPTMKKDMLRLRAFLALLPLQRRAAIEFRHASWFDDEVFGLLRTSRRALYRRC